MSDQTHQPQTQGPEDMVKTTVDAVSAALKQGADVVRKHPVESMLAGFGLGCLVGVLLSRRD